MKPTTLATLTERLREARQEAVATKITLRHTQNDASDYLTWLGGEVDLQSPWRERWGEEEGFRGDDRH